MSDCTSPVGWQCRSGPVLLCLQLFASGNQCNRSCNISGSKRYGKIGELSGHWFECFIGSNASSVRTNYQSYHPVQTLLKLGAMLAYPGIVMLSFPGIVRWLYPQLSLEKCVKGGFRVEAALIGHTKNGQVGILWIFKQLLVLP